MTLPTAAWAGYRNLLLIESYLAFSVLIVWMVRPATGYTPELLAAVGSLLLMVGGVVVAGITARAANKIADRWEPGAFRGGLAGKNGGTPSASPPE